MPGVQTCALRSEEHTSELQSHSHLVCRLLLEKKQALQARVPPAGRVSRAPGSRPYAGTAGAREERGRGVEGAGLRAVGRDVRLFVFNDAGPPEIHPLSLPDGLPI